MRNFSALIARCIASTITSQGDDFTLPDGTVCKATVTKVSPTTLPDQAVDGEDNAANADLHLARIPAFSVITPLKENQRVQWLGVDYIIDDIEPLRSDNTVVQWNLNLIRAPIAPTSAKDAEQKAKFAYVAPTT